MGAFVSCHAFLVLPLAIPSPTLVSENRNFVVAEDVKYL